MTLLQPNRDNEQTSNLKIEDMENKTSETQSFLSIVAGMLYSGSNRGSKLHIFRNNGTHSCQLSKKAYSEHILKGNQKKFE